MIFYFQQLNAISSFLLTPSWTFANYVYEKLRSGHLSSYLLYDALADGDTIPKKTHIIGHYWRSHYWNTCVIGIPASCVNSWSYPESYNCMYPFVDYQNDIKINCCKHVFSYVIQMLITETWMLNRKKGWIKYLYKEEKSCPMQLYKK